MSSADPVYNNVLRHLGKIILCLLPSWNEHFKVNFSSSTVDTTFFNKQNKKNCIRMTHQWYRCRVCALQCKAFTGFSFSFFLMFLSLGIAKTMTTALSLSSSLFPPILYPIIYKWVTSLLLWLLWIWTLRTKGYFSYTRGFLVFFLKHIYVWQGVTPQVAEIRFSKNIFFQEAVFEKRGTVHSVAEAFKIFY